MSAINDKSLVILLQAMFCIQKRQEEMISAHAKFMEQITKRHSGQLKNGWRRKKVATIRQRKLGESQEVTEELKESILEVVEQQTEGIKFLEYGRRKAMKKQEGTIVWHEEMPICQELRRQKKVMRP